MKAGDSFVNDLLALSHVPRWVIVRTVTPQTVADHSFRVAAIVLELWKRALTDINPANLVLCALIHDAAESVTGDIPSIVKNRQLTVDQQFVKFPDWATTFTEQELFLVKAADRIEEYTWLVLQGNGYHAQEVCDSLMSKIRADYEGGPLSDIIPELIREIVMEEGRLRTHADFPASQAKEVTR